MFSFLIASVLTVTDLPPTASLRIRSDRNIEDQKSGTLRTEFTFDASGSRDDKTSGTELEVRFDFENDGKVDTFFSRTKTARHIYASPGTYTVRLEVLDSFGNISETTDTVTAVENDPPISYFTVKPLTGHIATRFTFDAAGSNDAQYKISSLQYRWDFDGDGIFDTHFDSRARVEHRYKNPGAFLATLEAADPEGLTSQYVQMAQVAGNTPPVAAFAVKPSGVSYGFDASNSFDQETPISKLKFRWDFDYLGPSDISFDTSFSLGAKRTMRLIRPGLRAVRLQVMDETGAVSETFQTIDVPLPGWVEFLLKIPPWRDGGAPEILNVPLKKY